jgi:toxin ParE1/3/4
MKFRLTRPAIRDLATIGRYTRETWGEEQARRYRAAITARLKWLCRNRSLWRERSELLEGVYTYPEQSHVIVFREYEEGIEILRVLHQRMDLTSHVEDSEQN